MTGRSTSPAPSPAATGRRPQHRKPRNPRVRRRRRQHARRRFHFRVRRRACARRRRSVRREHQRVLRIGCHRSPEPADHRARLFRIDHVRGPDRDRLERNDRNARLHRKLQDVKLHLRVRRAWRRRYPLHIAYAIALSATGFAQNEINVIFHRAAKAAFRPRLVSPPNPHPNPLPAGGEKGRREDGAIPSPRLPGGSLP